MTRVVAILDSPNRVRAAAAAARTAGWTAVSVCSPAFNERLLQAVEVTQSPVGRWTCAGAVAGIVSGFILTIGTVRQWPGLIVSGKPLVAMPPFLIIVFELAILFAAIAAVASFLVACRRARRKAAGACSGATTDAEFTLLLESHDDSRDIDGVLRTAGALRWHRL